MFALLFAIAVGSTVSNAPAPVVIPQHAAFQGMRCGAPRPLENDSRQTVRVCEVGK